MRVELTPAAKAELAEALDWYDDQHPDLGKRFMGEFRALALRLSEHPRLFPTVRGAVRRAGFHRFPYGLFFRIQGDSWRCLPASMPAAIHAGGNAA
ncbi:MULTISPECIES: type II toxin-antitoxin system RelE/ParE family toxin [unclassified Azospirillum]|uniref:type II toxin-antitoxin system RelE/ParE family toxin n=1 Tax=unclassified Azospirillum TaxID=2630922 RepID=UPI000B78D1EE|nr:MULTISPECIES: type II toxin-antitoxin system RelE/ParE family toxin [unclassified Azospirillum]